MNNAEYWSGTAGPNPSAADRARAVIRAFDDYVAAGFCRKLRKTGVRPRERRK